MRPKSFFESDEWAALKRKVYGIYGFSGCMKCGKSKTELHIDHIKPRSKYPQLELSLCNMQILCSDCNYKKSNLTIEDYRPKHLVDHLVSTGVFSMDEFHNASPVKRLIPKKVKVKHKVRKGAPIPLWKKVQLKKQKMKSTLSDRDRELQKRYDALKNK